MRIACDRTRWWHADEGLGNVVLDRQVSRVNTSTLKQIWGGFQTLQYRSGKTRGILGRFTGRRLGLLRSEGPGDQRDRKHSLLQ